ncbi:unnamed protein product [Rotaria socialis]
MCKYLLYSNHRTKLFVKCTYKTNNFFIIINCYIVILNKENFKDMHTTSSTMIDAYPTAFLQYVLGSGNRKEFL